MKNICKQFIKNWIIIEDFAIEINKQDKAVKILMDEIHRQYVERKEQWKLSADEISYDPWKEIKIINTSNKWWSENIIRYFVEKT